MKQLLLLSVLFIGFNGSSQDSTIYQAFDFWVGDWEANWIDAKGNMIIGSNVITKELDGKVIRETFTDPSTGFLGTSISVYSPADSSWHQAWADNSGGYINFKGIVDEGVRIFQTDPLQKGDDVIVRRMMFYNIQPSSFDWDWEVSKDGGKTWKLAWQIKYLRKK
jgi:hypothetical protein